MFKRTKSGVTLVEILTASLILTLVIVPLMFMYKQSMDNISYTEDELKAFSIAQREIERIKQWNSINKQSLKDLSIVVKGENASNPRIEKGSKFKFYREIVPDYKINSSDISSSKLSAVVGKVTSTVIWKDKNGKSKKLSLNCYVEKKYY